MPLGVDPPETLAVHELFEPTANGFGTQETAVVVEMVGFVTTGGTEIET
jgi:hypothetical protein